MVKYQNTTNNDNKVINTTIINNNYGNQLEKETEET